MTRSTTPLLALLGAAALATLAPPARAEVEEVHLVRQFGLGYLPLTIMLHERLIEKHAVAAGRPGLKVKWSVLGNAVPINDGLIAGNIHFGSGGTAPMVTAWDRTRNNVRITGVGQLAALPSYLVSRHPYKSVKDFTDKDRLAMPGAGQSMQTLFLQMEVAKAYGIAEFKKLNPIFVNLSHPDAMAALLSGREVTAHFSSPPFQYVALEKGMHKVLSSYDVMGGPSSFITIWSTGRFRDESPKAFKAVLDALREAMQIIQQDRPRAARIYSGDVQGKEAPEAVEKQLADPEFIFGLGPRKVIKLTDFMHAAGVIKAKPASWKELFVPEVHGEDGD